MHDTLQALITNRWTPAATRLFLLLMAVPTQARPGFPEGGGLLAMRRVGKRVIGNQWSVISN